MVHLLKPAVIAGGDYQTSIGFTLGEIFSFGSLEFIADRFGSPSLSPDCPHHNHAIVGGLSSNSDHPNDPAMDYRIAARHWAPS
jgi:hypothetical protein